LRFLRLKEILGYGFLGAGRDSARLSRFWGRTRIESTVGAIHICDKKERYGKDDR